jgi:hypothetical protein
MENTKVDGLENKLAGMMRPVAPRKEFVRGLGSHIQNLRRNAMLASSNTWQFILLALAGILSLGVLVALAGRVLYNLLAGRKKQDGEM